MKPEDSDDQIKAEMERRGLGSEDPHKVTRVMRRLQIAFQLATISVGVGSIVAAATKFMAIPPLVHLAWGSLIARILLGFCVTFEVIIRKDER